MVIVNYPINGYSWLFLVILLMVIVGYLIGGYYIYGYSIGVTNFYFINGY
jgi:uncharacterized membrane protein